MSLGDIAARLPWPVFACGDDKRPVVATGFKAASRDRAIIMAQFDRPGASMIGVPTGKVSGIVAIDVDIKEGRDGSEWLEENRAALPETRTHRTRSGGLHLLFAAPDGVEIRNSASKVAPGVDVRGEGGYIIMPPSPGYLIADPSEPAEMPGWLVRACVRQDPPDLPPERPQERHERYTQAAIDGEVAAILRAGEGSRNVTLNTAAVRLGTLVGAGQMTRRTAEVELQQAGLAAGLLIREVLATIKSGLDFGVRNPREMPKTNGAIWHRPAGPEPEEPTAEPPPAKDAHGQKPRITITRFADVQPLVETADLVEDMLGIGTMSVIYGESNSGKTFFATDLGLHIACGWPWHDRHVERTGVIYCALEGTHGIRNRIAAFKLEHGLDSADVWFGFVSAPLNLCQSDEDSKALVAAINAEAKELKVKTGLIIMDTLARAMAGGNENAPDDMGALIRNSDIIRRDTGAHVMWVHHSGKDAAKGARGHTSLLAATDTEIEISVESAARTARVTKQRDYECTGTYAFTLKVVELGHNQRGKAVTSCVVEKVGEHTACAVAVRRLRTGHNKRALEVLADLVATSGQEGHSGVPTGYSSVPEKWWRERFYDRAMPGAEAEAKKKAFRRAADALIADRSVGMAAARVWCADRRIVMGP